MFFQREDKVIVDKPYLNYCSYCEREYGSRGLNGQELIKTFDHIQPLFKRISWDRKKYYCQSVIKLSNIIDCCNECNELKGCKTLNLWLKELIRFQKSRPKNKLNKLESIRIVNLLVLINTKPEPYKTLGNLYLEL